MIRPAWTIPFSASGRCQRRRPTTTLRHGTDRDRVKRSSARRSTSVRSRSGGEVRKVGHRPPFGRGWGEIFPADNRPKNLTQFAPVVINNALGSGSVPHWNSDGRPFDLSRRRRRHPQSGCREARCAQRGGVWRLVFQPCLAFLFKLQSIVSGHAMAENIRRQ